MRLPYLATVYYNMSFGKVIFLQCMEKKDISPEHLYMVRTNKGDDIQYEFPYSIFNQGKVAPTVGVVIRLYDYPAELCRSEFEEMRIIFPSLDCVICANFLGCFFRKREIFTIDSGKPVEYFEPHERGNMYLALKKMISMVEKEYGVTLDEKDFLCN
ncbi:MAG: hypothetical protein UFJ18_00020 [Blautia sp.]|nr:hypothetical protein [uncultured Blautia sp.]MED9965164.1 hypothetical protein [Blautia sp.]